jgi:putative sugar O-methyltransferase
MPILEKVLRRLSGRKPVSEIWDQPTPARHAGLHLTGEQDHIASARATLQRALLLEKRDPVAIHKVWSKARAQLRDYVLNDDFRSFLQHPVCRQTFFRTGWGAPQEYELDCLQGSQFGHDLLQSIADPLIGAPEMSPRLPRISTNMLGMMYYLLRVKKLYENRWPDRVVEVGGGYGAFSYLFCLQKPNAAYAIIDLPEMLALQHYFLSSAFPERTIHLASSSDVMLREGHTSLIPVSVLEDCHMETDFLFSTFAISEMPRQLQSQFENHQFWGARKLFLTGQLRTETPEFGWVPHGEVVGAVMEHYNRIAIERFHIGQNYILQAEQT